MTTLEERTRAMLSSTSDWPGETCCLKKYPRGDEKPSFMGYSAFGIVTCRANPGVIVYLRPDFVRHMRYDSVEACVADGWVVD